MHKVLVLSCPVRFVSVGQRNQTTRTRARLPDVRVSDMDLARGMVESEEATRNDWNGILLVVNAGKLSNLCIDILSEVLVTNLQISLELVPIAWRPN